jgi:hypothetical protein
MSDDMAWSEYEDDADGYCECGVFHTIEEMDSGSCDCCGKPIHPEDY